MYGVGIQPLNPILGYEQGEEPAEDTGFGNVAGYVNSLLRSRDSNSAEFARHVPTTAENWNHLFPR